MNVLIWGELGEDSMLQSGIELRINQNPPEFYFISVQVMRRTDSPYAPVNIIKNSRSICNIDMPT